MGDKPGEETAGKGKVPVAGLITLAVLTLACCGIGKLVIGGDDGEEFSTNDVPAYTLISQTDEGDVVVEVDQLLTEDQMRAIGEDIKSQSSDEHMYYIMINCSTGGTETWDNRLGNVIFGIGALGKAQSGLEEGEMSVKPNENRTCPASTAP